MYPFSAFHSYTVDETFNNVLSQTNYVCEHFPLGLQMSEVTVEKLSEHITRTVSKQLRALHGFAIHVVAPERHSYVITAARWRTSAICFGSCKGRETHR
jgi:hypothetical protein